MAHVKTVAMAAVLALSIAPLALAGCSSGSASSSSASSESTSMQQPASSESASSSAASSSVSVESVGQQTAGAATFELANKTGKAITGLSVKATTATEYPASLLAGGKSIENGTTVQLNCPAIDAPAASASSASAASSGAVALNATADIRLDMSDGSTYVLHQVVVDDVKDASVRVTDGIAYMEYTSKTDGKPVSMLEAEKAIAAQASGAAGAAAAGAAGAAGAAAAAGAAEAPQEAPVPEAAVEEPVPVVVEEQVVEDVQYVDNGAGEPMYYEETYDTGYDAGAAGYGDAGAYDNTGYDTGYDAGAGYDAGNVDDSAVGSGGEEACVDDIVFNF